MIGVVVPAHNAAKWIETTLRSLQLQTYCQWRCVVVDDGSADSTPDLVREIVAVDDRIQLICAGNSGPSAARNTGIDALDAECVYVAFLDSDDLLEPDAFEVLAGALAARPDAVGVYGLADYLDENGEPLQVGLHPSRQRRRHEIRGRRLRPLPYDSDAGFAAMVVYGPIWPPAVALQRLDDVRAVGGFDTSFPSQEDWDFYVRLSRRGPYVAQDSRVAWYRRHRTNITSDHGKSVFYQERVRHNAYVSPSNTALQRRQVARAWRYLEARQASVLVKHAVRCLAHGQVRDSGASVVGALICLGELVLPGPPPANLRRVRFTRPENHPGAVLIAE